MMHGRKNIKLKLKSLVQIGLTGQRSASTDAWWCLYIW